MCTSPSRPSRATTARITASAVGERQMFPMQTKSRRIAHMIANPMPPTPLVTALRVRYVECDMQGHVFNGHYLTWFDIAHTEALRAATGMSYPAHRLGVT